MNLRPIEAAAIAGEFYRATVDENSRWSPFAFGFRVQFADDRIEKPYDPKAVEDFRGIFGEAIDDWLRDRGLQLDP
ncbi:hypothetical protein [Aureimonas sp. SK2]|uniref:hypothetical protein n=1 Tax=Aureimonas sp. SK2 TaxID=3015992 RepID=UPI002443DE8D|nr:hypothetical protein [Aureimonas sp. SK2]